MKRLLGAFAILLPVFIVIAYASGTSSPPSKQSLPGSCSPARPHDPGRSEATIWSGGLERQYVLYVPDSYAGEVSVPLMLNFHGLDSTAWHQLAYSGLASEADREGFLLVSPQGAGAKSSWNASDSPGAPDDVAFVGDLLTKLEAQLCIDATRVYAAGLSNGGLMSARLACDLADRVAAVATVAGILPPGHCASSRPVPVIAFHGKADPLVPYGGGQVPGGGFVGATRPIEDIVSDWAAHNGCDGSRSTDRIGTTVQLFEYAQCVSNASVELYAIEDGGHTWPGASASSPSFGATDKIVANKLIWDFFAAHPMTPAAIS